VSRVTRADAKRAKRAKRDRDLDPLRYPGTFAFVGSGCLLALEIDGGRILAPTIGMSLYTWTSVIGVVLAGLSLGNFLGGRLADIRPGRSTLSYEYLAGAIAATLMLLLSRDLTNVAAPAGWSAPLQVLWLATLLLFLPSVLLGMVTPMIVKLELSSLDVTGRVVGRIQAAATLGSIFGVFLTGFLLISAFGTRAIVADIAIVLLVLAVASNPPWIEVSPAASRAAGIVVSAASLVTVAVAGLMLTYDNPCLRESKYYCIRVYTDPKGEFKQLSLDVLVNGIVSVKDPTALVYPYERLYGQVVDAKYRGNRPVTAFAIGGGTYTFPRYLEAKHHGNTLVAEIDPEVTEVVESEFGSLGSPNIRIINEDARPVLRDRPKSERYDVVLGDAFADIAIPFHLVTREFNELVKRHLKPDGLYLVNVVDGVHYDFLRSYIKTLMKTFPHVRLLVSPAPKGQQNAFVVVASMRPPPLVRTMIAPKPFARFLNHRETVTLTDDHVPVDQLLAPVFRQRLHQRPDTAQTGA
jgi:predicted membrane-bound spermidine synthase